MPWIIIIAYLILLYIANSKIDNQISKRLIIIYLSYWCVSLFLCSLNMFGLYPVEDSTYLLLLGHLIAFMLGYFTIKKRKHSNARKVYFEVDKIVRFIPFVILFIFCFIFVIRLYINQSQMLAIYSLSEIRGDFSDMVLQGGSYLLFSTVVTGMFHFCLCLSIYMLFFYRNWLYIVFFLVFSIMFALLGGGRHQFAFFIYYLLGMYILKDYIFNSITKKKSKFVISLKLKLASIIIVIGVVGAMALFTSLREGDGSNNRSSSLNEGFSMLSGAIVDYSLGPIVAFDEGLKIEQFKKHKYYGTATIGGTENILHILFLRFLIPDYKVTYKEVTDYLQQNPILVGPDMTWNYAYTSCFYYYCDFGFLGIFLIPFILGILFRYFIGMIESKFTIFSVAIYLFVSFCFYDSVFSGYLHKFVSILYIVSMLLLHSICSGSGNARHSIKVPFHKY